MDKKSKVFLWIFFLLIVASVSVTYWRIMIKKDYIIEAQADCDPAAEKCFIQECDPAAEECTGNLEEDTTYFKKISRKAANIPLCDPSDENCRALVCEEGEKDCVVTLCEDETKGEDDTCNDPEQYVAEHPVEKEVADEETAICEEGDQSCLIGQNGQDDEASNQENNGEVGKQKNQEAGVNAVKNGK